MRVQDSSVAFPVTKVLTVSAIEKLLTKNCEGFGKSVYKTNITFEKRYCTVKVFFATEHIIMASGFLIRKMFEKYFYSKINVRILLYNILVFLIIVVYDISLYLRRQSGIHL